MYVLSVGVSFFFSPPLGARYWSAISTPTTATTIHSQGPRKIRFTSMSRGDRPDLLPVRTIDQIDGTREFQRRSPGDPFPHCPPNGPIPPLRPRRWARRRASAPVAARAGDPYRTAG